MKGIVSDDVRNLAVAYRLLKVSAAALKNDTFHALFSQEHEVIARTAFEALETLDRIDTDFGYTMAMLEDFIESSDDCQCGWIISQSQPDGGFNKFCKTMGGTPPTSTGPPGDALIYTRWKSAKMVLDSYEPEIRKNFRIYPVVVVAGHEPRTTPPRDELLL